MCEDACRATEEGVAHSTHLGQEQGVEDDP